MPWLGVVWWRGMSARTGLRNLVAWSGVARRGLGGRGAGMVAGGGAEGAEAVFQQVKRLVEGRLRVAAGASQEPGHEAPRSALTAAAAATCGCRWV
jgi:hypothetical protein